MFTLVSKPATLELTPQAQKAYAAALSLDQITMEKWLELDLKQHPDNQTAHVIRNYYDFFIAFIKEEKELMATLQKAKESRIAAISLVADDNPLKKWALANIYLQSAAVRSKLDEPYSAAIELRKAFLLLQKNQEIFKDTNIGKVSLGFLYVLIGSIPPQYQWVVKLASMKGDVYEGKKMLYETLNATKNSPEALFRDEALFFLSFIETNLNPDKKEIDRVLAKFNHDDLFNPLLLFAKSNMELRSGRNDAALQSLLQRSAVANSRQLVYLQYMQAEALLRKLDLSAELFYQAYIQEFKGVNYVLDAKRKIAWISLLKGDTAAYLQAMHRLQICGIQPQNESDKQALREAAQSKMPNVMLLKARLLFDGGYYQQSEQALAEVGKKLIALSNDDQLEYFYRMGRVKQELANSAEALYYYNLTAALGQNNSAYYAANALLLSGELNENEGKLDKATELYKRCLNAKPEEYRLGIHARAKAGLNRIAQRQK